MNGHNPNKNYQADELQDVAALLRGLPQVKAPTNFDALLKARIAQAKVEQKADVTALLQELPRVAAPSDFDFKLRSRIAQAKYKEEKTSLLGWFSEVFGRSLLQTGAAMAAVALIVGAVTFQMMKPVDTPSSTMANAGNSLSIVPSATPANSEVIGTKFAVESKGEVLTATASAAPGVKSVQVKFTSPTPMTQAQRPKTNNLTPEKEIAVPELRDDLIASNTVLIKHSSSGEMRVVKVAEVSFGLQSASLRSNAPREDRGNMELASAQIVY